MHKLLCSSVDLHMCTLGGPTNAQMILHLSPSMLQHHWCNSLTSCSYSATQFIHILHLHLVYQVLYVPPQKKYTGVKSGELGGHVLGLPLPIHLLETTHRERLSLGWNNVDGLCLAGRCTL
jgi:hypothetical protein